MTMESRGRGGGGGMAAMEMDSSPSLPHPKSPLLLLCSPSLMDKRHILFFPVMLLGSFLLYLTFIAPGWLSLPTSSSVGPKLSEILIAEQRSLSLLQQQATDLLRLSDTLPNTSDGQLLRGQIASQIRINREIQEVLLSPYQQSSLGDVPGQGLSTCQTLESIKYKVKEGLSWTLKPGKFIFAVCTSGQFSNHLICIEKHMFFAALLGRALILPSPEFDYNYERLLNISHMQSCLGGQKIFTFDGYLQSHHNKLHVNRFLCYMRGCYLDADHEDKLKKLGISWDKKEDVWPNDPKLPLHPHASEILAKFTCDDEVIGVGDLFYADVEADWVNQVGGPLAHKCKSLLLPHNYISVTAERFIQTYLGKNFIALHFRRYGFLSFCNENSKKGYKCFFYPIPQAAECILRVVSSTSARVIYLSTDAQESETNLLQNLLYQSGMKISLVQRPDHNAGEKWDSLLQRHGVLNDKEVIAMLDKTICAMSNTFIGTPGSTFSIDIMRMRSEWSTSSTCDQYLCEGEEPDFIAGSD